MNIVLIISILIRLAALWWSILLVRRTKEWRMGILTLMLALMTLRQGMTLFHNLSAETSWRGTSEWAGLLVSILAWVAVFYVERLFKQRQKAEEALRASETKYRSIVEDMSELICQFTPDLKLTFVNKAYASYFGKTPEELVGVNFLAFIPEEDHQRIRDHFQKMEVDHAEAIVIHEVLTPEKKTRWQEWTDRAILDSSGNVISFHSMGRDITARKIAEEKLQKSEASLQNAQKITHIGSWEWNIETGETYWSDEFFRICGLDASTEPALETALALIHPEQQEVATAIRAAIKNRHSFDETVKIIRLDGAMRHVHAQGDVMRFRQDRPALMAGTFQDVTENTLAKLEKEHLIAELQAKNSELERFTYTISHDLKSPLFTIKGFVGLLEQDIEDCKKEEIAQDIGYINDAANKMDRLLDVLLKLSRIGRVVNPSEKVSMSELAQEAVNIVMGLIIQKEIAVEIMPEMPGVFVDRVRVVEALQNLLDNAIKFMGEQPQPQITIGVRQDGRKQVFFVKDNGLGIEKAYLEKVWDLFQRLDTKEDGSGIGLGLVKRIIEVHGGSVWIESEGLGQGTTVCFTLPAQEKNLH